LSKDLQLRLGGGKIRGHLGSELKNKCDFILNVSQPEDNQYIVMNPASRYRRLPSMEFTRAQNGDPIYDMAQVSRQTAMQPATTEDLPF
jgi:hypothetical protein